MRSGIIAAALLLLLGSAASAQQLAQTPLEQALGAKLLSELNGGLTCASTSIELQRTLAASQTRVRELEARYEPTADKK